MKPGEVERLRGESAEFVADVFGSVPRRDQRRWGECCLRGLMLDGRRKSVLMAERLPDGNMQALQQFVNQSPWDPLPVRRRIAERLCAVVRPEVWVQPRRPSGGGGAGGEGLGRSRGGFTTKLRLSADGHRRPLAMIITPGQQADCTQFQPVLEKIRVPKSGPGRPRKTPDSVTADKAYSNRPCRDYLRRRGIRHTLPEKTDSQAARLRKGSRGGRPPGFEEERYKKRNTLERAINRLMQHRAVATRYDKRRHVYLGTATAAALVIWLRS